MIFLFCLMIFSTGVCVGWCANNIYRETKGQENGIRE